MPPELRRHLEALRKDSTLTPERFATLLASLADEPEQAAERYEQMRRGLVAFFEYRETHEPEADADETLDRAVRRLSEGQHITSENPASYFYGIARNLWRERLATRRVAVPLDEIEPTTWKTPLHLLEERDQQRMEAARLACLRECLQKFAPADRELLRAYASRTLSSAPPAVALTPELAATPAAANPKSQIATFSLALIAVCSCVRPTALHTT